MSLYSPYIVRRGHSLSFRIAVPIKLRILLGCRELVRTLRTGDRHQATPLALQMAANAKRLFFDLNVGMHRMDEKKLFDLVRETKHKLDLDEVRSEGEQALLNQQVEHRSALRETALRVRAETMQEMTRYGTPTGVPAVPPSTAPEAAGPSLSDVVKDFLGKFRTTKKSMLAKHQTVLPALVEVIGDKPVGDLRQGDINAFFEVFTALPPRWGDIRRRTGASVRQIAKSNEGDGLNKKTFDSTYLASVRPFLEWAINNYGDVGFPRQLSTRGIEYRGERIGGEKRQRALRLDELKRLFEGAEMRAFAGDPEQEHRYWLPHVGLFTGARVNEICQVNPQADVIDVGGVWCLVVTEETDGDERIDKSVKNKVSMRTVPVHAKLVELGFIDYLKRVKATKAKLLFPRFAPARGKASGGAEKWFRQFLKDLALRDETPGACVLGMHAFRSTLLSRGADSGLSLEPITGHAEQGKSAVVRGYEGERAVTMKKALIDQVHFDIDFIASQGAPPRI